VNDPNPNSQNTGLDLPAQNEPLAQEGTPPSSTIPPPAALPVTALPVEAPAPKASQPLRFDRCIAELDLRTPAEELEFQECEAIIREGWAHFARVGAALARIRNKQLYKNEYSNFEVYCRERWGFGQAQGSRYIAAAQIQQTLETVPGVPLPECEAQVRPLIGLPAELAQQAWLNALSSSRDGHVYARLVKRAVRRVLKSEVPGAAAKMNVEKKERSRLKQSIRTGFQELLALLLGNGEREVLIAKVQEIERLLNSFLDGRKIKR
jgi:hypothetical protein